MSRLSPVTFAALACAGALCNVGCLSTVSNLTEEVGEFEVASYGQPQAFPDDARPAAVEPPIPTIETEPVATSYRTERVDPIQAAQAELTATHRPRVTASGTRSPAPTQRVLPEQVVVATPNNTETVTMRSGAPKNFVVRTTAYTHLEADSLPYGTKTARGDELKFGQLRSAAADWSRYPVGTRFKIKGLPYEYIVDDYGSALVGTDTIDLYKPDHGMMNHWGAREVGIEVIKWGSFKDSHEIIRGRVNKGDFPHLRVMLREIEQKLRFIPTELQDGFNV